MKVSCHHTHGVVKRPCPITGTPRRTCLQPNPQIQRSEAEHASVRFTTLKEKQHIHFLLLLLLFF